MSNAVVMPMIIPLLAGIFLLFCRYRLRLQRIVSVLAMVAAAAASFYLLEKVRTEGILRIDFGNWKPPFGILFVADSFSLLLTGTTAAVAAIIFVYAAFSIGEERERFYFYPFALLMVAGVNGSFLTGDLFNLYVCFEVMLLASYALITLGGTKLQLRESLKYVLINVLSSWFFLVGIAYLYGTLGTLNLAHLSVRVAEAGQTPILTVIAVMLLLVFALKAGLLLYFWLPGSYSAPPTAIAALFGSLLTKVGIYSMFRVFTLIFYHETEITHGLIGMMAGLTMIGGSIGAIAFKNLKSIAAYNVVIAVGFIMAGLAVMNVAAVEGAIFYLVHDMVAKALLFLLAGTVITLTGKAKIEEMSGLIRNYPLLGWLFFLVMLALAGIPPLSGFLGKLLVAQGAVEGGAYLLLALALLSSIAVLYSLLQIFLNSFWGETIISEEEQRPMKKGWIIPCAILALLSIGLGFGAEAIAPYVRDAADTLLRPDRYIGAVLGE